MGRICEIGVHFRIEALKFAPEGFWVCCIQKWREPNRSSGFSRQRLKIQNGRHKNRISCDLAINVRILMILVSVYMFMRPTNTIRHI